jgi:hypothetical protein
MSESGTQQDWKVYNILCIVLYEKRNSLFKIYLLSAGATAKWDPVCRSKRNAAPTQKWNNKNMSGGSFAQSIHPHSEQSSSQFSLPKNRSRNQKYNDFVWKTTGPSDSNILKHGMPNMFEPCACSYKIPELKTCIKCALMWLSNSMRIMCIWIWVCMKTVHTPKNCRFIMPFDEEYDRCQWLPVTMDSHYWTISNLMLLVDPIKFHNP